MPVRSLPPNPNLDHLKYQAKDLLKGHAARDPRAGQQIREFHPRFRGAADAAIFEARLSLSDAQLTIAREHGFPNWARLKAQIDKPRPSNELTLPHHERIEDATFRHAVDVIDAGDAEELRVYLSRHPDLVRRQVVFEGVNYFRNPTLFEFIAENPVRHGTLPPNIVEVAQVILDAGAQRTAMNEALGLISSGRVPRECGVQVPLIDLLCDRGAEPGSALKGALLHGEFAAVEALIRRGAPLDLPVAAGLGRVEDFRRLLPAAGSEDRHLALALGSQFGHVQIVRLLLDEGEDPNRYNPAGAHSHSTPLHQAALGGHDELVRLLVERGANVNFKDVLWQGTAAGWAKHAGRTELETYLRSKETEEPAG